MDNKRFDDMARTLASRATRRGTLRGLLGAGVASLVGVAKGADAGAQDVGAAKCIADGKTCGRKVDRPPCGTCCSNFVRRGVGGKANRCSCRPTGTVANPNRADQCCSGVVGGGRCVDPTPPPPPPPPPPPGPPPPQQRQLVETGTGTFSGPDCDPSTPAGCPFAFVGIITGGTPIAAGTFAGTLTVRNLQPGPDPAVGEGDVAGPVTLTEAGTGAQLTVDLVGRVTVSFVTGAFRFAGVYRVTGGTGRFAGASGAGTAAFQGIPDPGTEGGSTVTAFTLTGTVTV